MARRLTSALVVVLVVALILALPALANPGPGTMDGNFDDWVGTARVVDPGGVDDETSPGRADVTEAAAFADTNGIYFTMAWDDTEFGGGGASTAGITLRSPNPGPAGTIYRIYATASGTPGSVLTSTVEIRQCGDATCKLNGQTVLCTGSACAGLAIGSSTTWTDPFSRTPAPGCSGANCGTLDTAVEMYIPWALVGGAPPAGRSTFFDFGSYPSGPAAAPKDNTGNYGITCVNDPLTGYNCYRSNPNAIEVSGGAVSGAPGNWAPVALAGGVVALAGLVLVRRRKA